MALDSSHAVWNRHAPNSAAAAERLFPNTCHAVRYRHARKTIAIEKRIIPDVGHTIRNHQVLNQQSIKKQILRVGERIGNTIAKRDTTPIRKIRDVYALKSTAIVERIRTDARHAVGYRHVRKPSAIVKRIVPDVRHAVTNDDIPYRPICIGEH